MKRIKSFLAVLLAFAFILTATPLSGFAAEVADNGETTVTQPETNENETPETEEPAKEYTVTYYSNGKKYGDYAILYRVNELARSLETTFTKSGIPYRILGGQRFYDRKEIRDMLAYLTIACRRLPRRWKNATSLRIHTGPKPAAPYPAIAGPVPWASFSLINRWDLVENGLFSAGSLFFCNLREKMK